MICVSILVKLDLESFAWITLFVAIFFFIYACAIDSRAGIGNGMDRSGALSDGLVGPVGSRMMG